MSHTHGGSAATLTLPHRDPVAVELTSAIHGGDLDSLRRLLVERPALASARMIGRKGLEGGWRTPLHAAADWPGYFPAAPAAVVLLIESGADPNDDTGGARPETPLHWAASSDDVEVAAALIDGGAELDTAGGSIGTQLLARGADPNWVPEYAEGTALDAASSLGTRQENVLSWLRERGAASAAPRD